MKSNADVQLPEHGKIEALVKLSKLVFMLHGYGKHPFLASRVSYETSLWFPNVEIVHKHIFDASLVQWCDH